MKLFDLVSNKEEFNIEQTVKLERFDNCCKTVHEEGRTIDMAVKSRKYNLLLS